MGRVGPGADQLQDPPWERRPRAPEAPPSPDFLAWLNPRGFGLDFRGAQNKPEGDKHLTGTCLQQEILDLRDEAWEMELPVLTLPGHPLQVGCRAGLLYQHTFVVYLLRARDSHTYIDRQLIKDCQMNVKFR